MSDGATTVSAFQLSRLYAEGWNAASKVSSEAGAEIDPAKMNALNPHKAEPQRSKWNDGFTAFMRKDVHSWGEN